MNEKIEVPTMRVPPLKKLCMTIGQLPASYIETMSYYEMLIWFVHYLRDDIIPVVNANGEATQELQELYVELQNYVNNYFDNLDVQDEINKKLDEMAESGQLTDIIAQYLGLAGMIAFDSVADMKLAENLVNGSKCHTLGFRTANDRGDALYKIRQVTNDDVIDEKTIIAVHDDLLVAELIKQEEMSPEQFGAYGDGTHDDTSAFTTATSFCKNIKGLGTYKVNTITLNNVNINCNIKTGENTGLIFGSNVYYKGNLQNGVESTESAGGKCIYVTGTNNIIEDSLFDGVYTGCGVVLENDSLNNRISNCIFDPCFKVDVLVSGSDVIIEKCKFNEHTVSTVSPISSYDNAVKISQYLDLSGTNGKNIVIRDNFMYEHGDNPIDCYTGGTNVIIDSNFIFSPAHECIEIKCGNSNEENVNYKIINNTLHGSRCLYIGQTGTGVIKNFIVDGNYFKNYEAAGSVIINNYVETFISNCVFEYDSTVSSTAFGIAPAYSGTPTDYGNIHVDNCFFTGGTSVLSIASDYYKLYMNNCLCEGMTRFSRVNVNSEFYINNCDIKTTNDCFGALKGTLLLNNSKLDCTYAFAIQDSTANVAVSNCNIKASSRVFEVTSGKTPKIGMNMTLYDSPSLCNKTFSAATDFTTISD